jgi:pyridoxal phosphate enzyme (YggS family)
MIDVAGNVEHVRERVAAAAQRAGRQAEDVCIVAVAKTKPAELIRAACRAGLSDVGENYLQEAEAKMAALSDLALTWHMIGHLQRNKAKRAVQRFHVLQTVDSIGLAQALNRHAAQADKVVSVLVEVRIGGEVTKSGVAPEEAPALMDSLAGFEQLSVDGLMTVPPPASDPQAARANFRALRVLRDRLKAQAPANAPLHELSMGMTDDFEAAIEEGATLVRIGRASFGERGA